MMVTISYGLRLWKREDFIPREEDVFQERLYAIKYIEKFETKTWQEVMKKPAYATDTCYGNVHYVSPSKRRYKKRRKNYSVIKERINEWQEKGYIPNSEIEPDRKQLELQRRRGGNTGTNYLIQVNYYYMQL